MMNDTATITRQNWNGIEIEVSWKPDWLSFDDGTGTGHLEIRSVRPEREPLPMTETGYRSHFLHPSIIDNHGGPDAYVAAWLQKEAVTPEWLASDLKHRQGSLF
jgi:hypothetical protein